jgi:N-acetylglucosamine kinase-like BadF-type ATPase
VDSRAVANADSVFPRVFPVVAVAADSGNPLAQSLLTSAAQKLATLALRLAESLSLGGLPVPMAKAGGAIGRSRFFDQAIDDELRRSVPEVKLISLKVDSAEAAAWIAFQLLQSSKGLAR